MEFGFSCFFLKLKRGNVFSPMFWLSVMACAWLVFGGSAHAENRFEYHILDDFSVTNNHVSGPGRDNSTLTRGGNYLNIMSLYGNGNVDDAVYDFTIGGKLTDDSNYDTERVSLTNFAVNAATPYQAVSLGDTFQAFSQYTLTSAVKGAAYRYLGGHGPWIPKVTFLYGYAYP